MGGRIQFKLTEFHIHRRNTSMREALTLGEVMTHAREILFAVVDLP